MEKYNRKNPVINRNFLIKFNKFENNKNDDNVRELIYTLYDTEFLLPINYKESRQAAVFSPCLLQAEDKSMVLPIFTNQYEIAKVNADESCKTCFDGTETYVFTFEELEDIYNIISENVNNIVIDPFGINFTITKEMLDISRKIIDNSK